MSFYFISIESSTATEEILLGRETVEVPVQLYASQQIFSILFSRDTWHQHISQDIKTQLMVSILMHLTR